MIRDTLIGLTSFLYSQNIVAKRIFLSITTTIVAINSAERVDPTTGLGPANFATNVAYVVDWLRSQGQ
jgi:hypothetical protein